MGLFGTLKDQVGSIVEQGLSSTVPVYAYIRDQYRKRAQKQRTREYKENMHYTDKQRIAKKARKEISREISGNWNPFSWIWNIGRMLFGSNKQERISNEIQDLTEIADDLHAFEDGTENIKFLVKEIKKQVSKKLGLFSRLGITTSKKAMNDPIVKNLKDCAVKWLQPFRELLAGAVPNVRFTGYEENILKLAEAELRNSVYTRDIAEQFRQVLHSYHQQRAAAKTA